MIVIKKLVGMMMVLLLLLVGCGDNTSKSSQNDQDEKKIKIEIYSVDENEPLTIIDDKDTIDTLLYMSDWEELDSISADLIPEYILLVYQEKTLLFGQNPDEERDDELIEMFILYNDIAYITEIISNTVIKNMIIPESALTFHYRIPDDDSKRLHEVIV